MLPGAVARLATESRVVGATLDCRPARASPSTRRLRVRWSTQETRPAALDLPARGGPCRCGKRRSSGSAPWWVRDLRAPRHRGRGDRFGNGSRFSSLEASPSCRATPSRGWVRGTPPPEGSWSTSSRDGDRLTSPASSPGCCSRSTPSSRRWWLCPSAVTPACRRGHRRLGQPFAILVLCGDGEVSHRRLSGRRTRPDRCCHHRDRHPPRVLGRDVVDDRHRPAVDLGYPPVRDIV